MRPRTRTITALALLPLALAACGGGDDTSNPSASPSTSASATPTPTPTETAEPTASTDPTGQQTYDNPNPDQTTGEALAETPPPGDDTAPQPNSSATDPTGQIQANAEAGAGKDVSFNVTAPGPATASWMAMTTSDQGKEAFSGSWSKTFPGAGAGLYVLDVQTEDLTGTVTCQVLVDGVVRSTETGEGQLTCTQPADANN